MGIACLVVGIVLAAMTFFSGVGKLRKDSRIVTAIHETCRVPMRCFPLLAACEIAGAAGVVLGFWWPPLGAAAAGGLVVYFLGAVIAHLRVGDSRGIGPAAFLLTLSLAALVLRILRHGVPL